MPFRFRSLAPYLFVGPAVLAVAIFLYGPLIASMLLSVVDWNLLSADIRFVGVENYASIFDNPDFRMAAWNTLLYCAVLIPAEIVIPLIFAVMLHSVRKNPLQGLYRGSLFLPTIVAYSAAGVAWSWLFNPVNGLLNEILGYFGFPPSRWHTDPSLALLCVSLGTFWKTFNISLPLMTPTAFFISVTTFFHVLDDIVGIIDVLTHGGPAGRSSSLLYFLWQQGLLFFQFGPASAVAVIIIVIILAVTWLEFRVGEKRVHYK